MSRKHFVVVAATLKSNLDAAKTPEAREAVIRMINDLAADFAGFNPNFNAKLFKTAAGDIWSL